jgi:hypothetical protein
MATVSVGHHWPGGVMFRRLWAAGLPLAAAAAMIAIAPAANAAIRPATATDCTLSGGNGPVYSISCVDGPGEEWYAQITFGNIDKPHEKPYTETSTEHFGSGTAYLESVNPGDTVFSWDVVNVS